MANIKYDPGQMCSVCGKRQATVRGMCKSCYTKKYCHKYNSEYYQKKRREKKPVPKKYRGTEQTKKIVAEYKTGEITQADLAKKYDLSRQRISQIIRTAKIMAKNTDEK